MDGEEVCGDGNKVFSCNNDFQTLFAPEIVQ